MNNLSKDDYISYLRSQMHRWDQQNVLNTARLEGREQGRLEGREEGQIQGIQIGQEETQKRIARSMKKQGIAPNIIADITGLNITALERL